MKQLRKFKTDRRGLSLVELIAVVAILAVLAVVVTGSLSRVASMRARKAARITEAMLAQCRVDNLSGRQSTLQLSYSSGSDTYIAELQDGSGSVYKREELGSGRAISLTAAASAYTADIKTQTVTVTFSMETGKAESLSIAGGDDTWDFARFTVNGSRTVTLTRLTGSAELS